MNRTVIVLSIVLALALMLLRLLEYQYLNRNIHSSLYIGLLISVALAVGIWFGREFFLKKQTGKVVVQNEKLDRESLLNYGLSKREFEILDLIDQGFTNQQIADRLFVSLNTIKTHTTNIYQKLDVKNRVQAIAKAKTILEA